MTPSQAVAKARRELGKILTKNNLKTCQYDIFCVFRYKLC